MLKLIQIQRNVVSDIANIVIVSIMESSNFLHDVWFDIFFLIERKLSNLCILKILQISKHHDMSVHRLFSTHSRVFNSKGVISGCIFNSFLFLKSRNIIKLLRRPIKFVNSFCKWNIVQLHCWENLNISKV